MHSDGQPGSDDERPFALAEHLPTLVSQEDEARYARDPGTFWCSHIGFCPRQTYLSKLGLRDTADVQGRFAAGRLVQQHIEQRIAEEYPSLETDVRAVYDADGGIEIVGRPTCYDPDTRTVYHLKTRNGWYQFTPPVERHLHQLHSYMAGLDATHGKLLYISLNDLTDIRAWPPIDAEHPYESLDMNRIESLVAKAQAIRSEILSNGIATDPSEIPFEPCNCYLCDEESLTFPEIEDAQTALYRTEPPTSSSTSTGETNNDSAMSADGGVYTAGELAAADTQRVVSDCTHVPKELREHDIWTVWDCREKIALAPWQTDTMYPCEWAAHKNIDPRRPFEKAQMVCELSVEQIHEIWPFPDPDNLPETVKPAVLLPHERTDVPFVFVDFDDVRDPATGETTVEVCNWLKRLGGYAEISRSGTGVHVYVKAELPEELNSFAAALDGPGQVEVYDGARFTGGTWNHIGGTSKDELPHAQPEIEALLNRYNTHTT